MMAAVRMLDIDPITSTALPLLLEPLPAPGDLTAVERWHGWRLRTTTSRPHSRWGCATIEKAYVRHRDDDEKGALVQYAICWYALCGVERQEIARRLTYSERAVQGWLSGTAWQSYTQPVLTELRTLGISTTRFRSGRQQAGRYQRDRSREIAAAAVSVLQDVWRLLEHQGPPTAAVALVKARTRLLSVRWEAP